MSNAANRSTEIVEIRPRVKITKEVYDRLKSRQSQEVRKTEGELISSILEREFKGH